MYLLYLQHKQLVLDMVTLMLNSLTLLNLSVSLLHADLMFALISTEELEDMNQIMVKQLKNRYNDLNMNKRFVVGIDRSKMRLYNVEASAQGNIIDSGRDSETMESLDNKIRNFEGFKV